MSNWKVSKECIALFPHPNADKLELAKAGTYQMVVQKGMYKTGDAVVLVPEKSVLTGRLREEFANYLVGPKVDRVKSITLRGEVSAGILLSPVLVHSLTGSTLEEFPDGEDLSARLGIAKYEPPIPSSLAGDVYPIPDGTYYGSHDCEQFGIYRDQFVEGERVVITEKIHGSQAIYIAYPVKGTMHVTSKGLLGRGLALKESQANAYWQAAPEIRKRIGNMAVGGMSTINHSVQVFGELLPCQGAAWAYGQQQKTVRVFDVRLDGCSVPYDELQEVWGDVWVPVLYDGPFNADNARQLRAGKEQVSGKELHIREGVVVRPYVDRRASDGTRLCLKIINPAYKETGDEIN